MPLFVAGRIQNPTSEHSYQKHIKQFDSKLKHNIFKIFPWLRTALLFKGSAIDVLSWGYAIIHFIQPCIYCWVIRFVSSPHLLP